MKRLVFITGPPRVGKTTLLLRAAEELTARGYTLGGMISREILQNGVRVGFEIIDYRSGEKGWLAHIHQPVGPRIGKYRVNLQNLNSIGVNAIQNALKTADGILIDEIGPMELCSKAFREVVQDAIQSEKLIVGTIHFRAQDPLISLTRSRKDAYIVELTSKNGAQLLTLILNKIIKLSKTKVCEG
ncbi:MAG: NTPase [Candidatus Bathyarchaeota archaeon]|nr:MAG: NTPase [Candidatus Bathyarchaeota archaeon]